MSFRYAKTLAIDAALTGWPFNPQVVGSMPTPVT
jgi:hypothetical protein